MKYSDEEFDKFLENIEQDGLLSAPSNMKESILKQTKAGGTVLEFNPGKANITGNSGRIIKAKKKREMFFYSLKISAATVAAILLLGVINVQSGFSSGDGLPQIKREPIKVSTEKIEEKSVSKRLQEQSNAWSDALNKFSNMLLTGKEKEN